MDCRVNPDVSDSLFCAIKMLRVKDKNHEIAPHTDHRLACSISRFICYLCHLSPSSPSPAATRFMTIDIFFNFPPRINVVMSCSVPGATTSFFIHFTLPPIKVNQLPKKSWNNFVAFSVIDIEHFWCFLTRGRKGENKENQIIVAIARPGFFHFPGSPDNIKNISITIFVDFKAYSLLCSRVSRIPQTPR